MDSSYYDSTIDTRSLQEQYYDADRNISSSLFDGGGYYGNGDLLIMGGGFDYF